MEIRKRIAEHCEEQLKLSGVVEVDESYFGPRRVRGKRGRGAGHKTIVFGIFKRNGHVYTEIVPDARKGLLAESSGLWRFGGLFRYDSMVMFRIVAEGVPMSQIELFEAALGVAQPWRVSDASLDPDEGRLDLYLDFPRGAHFSCPEGDARECPVHDTDSKTWRHLDFFQHQAYLHARVPRVVCPEHGTRQVSVPWAREGSGFTVLFEAFVLELAPHMPVAAIARMVGEHDTRIWRVLEHYVEAAREELDFSEVERV